MIHHKLKPTDDIRVGDYVPYRGQFREVWCVSQDDGLLVEGTWMCASKLYDVTISDSLVYEI